MQAQITERDQQIAQLQGELLRLQLSLDDIKASIAGGLGLGLSLHPRARPSAASNVVSIGGSRNGGGGGGRAKFAEAAQQGQAKPSQAPVAVMEEGRPGQRRGLLGFVRGMFGGSGNGVEGGGSGKDLPGSGGDQSGGDDGRGSVRGPVRDGGGNGGESGGLDASGGCQSGMGHGVGISQA